MKLIRKRNRVKRWQWKFGAIDIETSGLDARKFLFGVAVWNEKDGDEIKVERKIFYSRYEMADFITQKRFRGYIWWGHNLGAYDLMALFGNYMLRKEFKVIFNKSRFIKAVYQRGKDRVYFMDSLNIFSVPLEKLGRDIGYSKEKTPDWLKISLEDEDLIRDMIAKGEWTKAQAASIFSVSYNTIEKILNGGLERHITGDVVKYCIRDAEIVLKAITEFSKFLYDKWKVRISSTIASIALRVFFTDYIDGDLKVSRLDSYFRNSYYGGRVEVFAGRGRWNECYYYDFNSLYPSVMHEFYVPDSSDLHYMKNPDIRIVQEYEGVSHVQVYIPKNLDIPPLPYRTKEGKLIFPVGVIEGWWNHNELRMAMKYGVKILKLYESVYSTRIINPFKSYVEDLYKMRLEFRRQGNDTGSLYTKLLLNSLYGKFAQRVEKSRYGWIDEGLEHKGWVFEPYGKESDFGVWKKLNENGNVIVEDARHDVICWASYITSWSRIKLYEAIMEARQRGAEIYYCDTDSLALSKPVFESSKELGKLKLEKEGWIRPYAPKVYEFKLRDGTIYVKAKGVRNAKRIQPIYYERRVVKVKEALRRGLEAGQGELRVKKLSLKDEKRIWYGSISRPICYNVVGGENNETERGKIFSNIASNSS